MTFPPDSQVYVVLTHKDCVYTLLKGLHTPPVRSITLFCSFFFTNLSFFILTEVRVYCINRYVFCFSDVLDIIFLMVLIVDSYRPNVLCSSCTFSVNVRIYVLYLTLNFYYCGKFYRVCFMNPYFVYIYF